MPTPPEHVALAIVGKLLDNAGAVAIVAISVGALVFATLFALSTYGVRAWRTWKGRNGNHVVLATPDGARLPLPGDSGPSHVRVEELPGAEVSGRDLGRIEGRLDALALGHRGLREDLNRLTATVATRADLEQLKSEIPEAAAAACIEKLLDRGIIEDLRLKPRDAKT